MGKKSDSDDASFGDDDDDELSYSSNSDIEEKNDLDTDNETTSESEDSNTKWIIIGTVVGVAIIAVIVFLLVWFLVVKKDDDSSYNSKTISPTAMPHTNQPSSGTTDKAKKDESSSSAKVGSEDDNNKNRERDKDSKKNDENEVNEGDKVTEGNESSTDEKNKEAQTYAKSAAGIATIPDPAVDKFLTGRDQWQNKGNCPPGSKLSHGNCLCNANSLVGERNAVFINQDMAFSKEDAKLKTRTCSCDNAGYTYFPSSTSNFCERCTESGCHDIKSVYLLPKGAPGHVKDHSYQIDGPTFCSSMSISSSTCSTISMADFFLSSITVIAGNSSESVSIRSFSHLFGTQVCRQIYEDPALKYSKLVKTSLNSKINIIPYGNRLQSTSDADGDPVDDPDSVLSYYVPPRRVGLFVTHSSFSPSKRNMFLEQMLADTSVQGLQTIASLFDLHTTGAGATAGVVVSSKQGVAMKTVYSITAPQDALAGRFSVVGEEPIFLKLGYPAAVSNLATEFNDNIRSFLILFNSVTKWPESDGKGDYLRGDDYFRVETYTRQMLRTYIAHATTKQCNGKRCKQELDSWWENPANKVYEHDFLHLAVTAGTLFPLNSLNIVHLHNMLTLHEWQSFKELIQDHNDGEGSTFTKGNTNKYVSHIKIRLPSEDLLPMESYVNEDTFTKETDKAVIVSTMCKYKPAFQLWNVVDLFSQFFESFFDKESLGLNFGIVASQALATKEMNRLKGHLLGYVKQRLGKLNSTEERELNEVFSGFIKIFTRPVLFASQYKDALNDVYPRMAKWRILKKKIPSVLKKQFLLPATFVSMLKTPAQQKMGSLKVLYSGHGVRWPFVTKSPPIEAPDDEADSGLSILDELLSLFYYATDTSPDTCPFYKQAG